MPRGKPSLDSLQDAVDVLNRWCATPVGLRVTFATQAARTSFRQRIYMAREAMREESKKLFSPDEPGYNSSPYEDMYTTLDETADGQPVLEIKRGGKITEGVVRIEEIEDD